MSSQKWAEKVKRNQLKAKLGPQAKELGNYSTGMGRHCLV